MRAKAKKGIRKECSRGHVFYKSSSCPVCPKCWPGYQKKLHSSTSLRVKSDLPKIGAPALRALANKKIKNMNELSRWSKVDVAELHGVGPKALDVLTRALKKNGLLFDR